ncbi:MAG: HEAT repeat domain-containing protein, partial [Planctomycetota bacterium]
NYSGQGSGLEDVLVAQMTREKSRFVRLAVARSIVALAEAGSSRALLDSGRKLLPFLRDSDAKVRARIATAIGRLATPTEGGLVAALVAAVGDPDHQVRRSAVQALGRIRAVSDAVVEALEEARSTDEDEAVKRYASEALDALRKGTSDTP